MIPVNVLFLLLLLQMNILKEFRAKKITNSFENIWELLFTFFFQNFFFTIFSNSMCFPQQEKKNPMIKIT